MGWEPRLAWREKYVRREILLTIDHAGASTESQPVTLLAVRSEADQLNSDGDCIVLQNGGPLRLEGGQRVPRIALLGSLNVEPEQHHVAVPHDVLLALGPNDAFLLRALPPAVATKSS